MKRHVICLGDSNTHGYCGAQEGETLCGGRFSEAERWPCLLQRALGEEYLVIEEGLCGRTTVFPDPLAVSYTHLDVYKRQVIDLVDVLQTDS